MSKRKEKKHILRDKHKKLKFIKNFFKTFDLDEIPEDLDNKEKINTIYYILTNGFYRKKIFNGEHYMGLYFDYKMKHTKQAKKWYLKSINKGNMYSIIEYAFIMENENKNEEAKKYYLMGIEKGNVDSMVNYADIIRKQNHSEAKKYYLMAIEKGNADAMFEYAYLLEKERHKGSQKSSDEIKKYYLMAIEKGNIEAMNNYAILLINEGDETNDLQKYYEAEKYISMAIDKEEENNAFKHNYARILEKINVEKSKKYYLLAIEKGNIESIVSYDILMDNLNNFEEAKKYYLMAISKKYSDKIITKYAYMLQKQELFSEAKKWYLKAIKYGNVDAINNYAFLTEKEIDWSDENCPKFLETKKYYLMAIDLKNDVSMLNYAYLLEKSRNQNFSEIKKYYLMAIEYGNTDALFYYANFIKNTDTREAIKYYYKHYEKTNNQTSLSEIKILNSEEMAIIMGQIINQNDELVAENENLRNYRKAVNDLGPMNALVLGYI